VAGVRIPAWALFFDKKMSLQQAAIVTSISFCIVLLLYILPTGTYAISSGTLIPVERIVIAETRYNTGEILLAPIAFYARAFSPPGVLSIDASPIIYVRALIDKDIQLHPLSELTGPQSSPAQYEREQQLTRVHAEQVPLAVALQQANASFELRTGGVIITAVLDDSPAKDVLNAGDIITQIDDRQIRFTENIIAIVQQSNSQGVNMTLTRDNETFSVFAPTENGRIGLRVENYNVTLVHDTPITINLGAIGGSSGDILVALEAYSIITQQDIVKNRIISGSGSLTVDGRVRPVRGVDLKAQTAKNYGADIFFMSQQQEIPIVDGLNIVQVTSFSQIISALEE